MGQLEFGCNLQPNLTKMRRKKSYLQLKSLFFFLNPTHPTSVLPKDEKNEKHKQQQQQGTTTTIGLIILCIPIPTPIIMGRQKESLRSKAAHFVSDLTTVFLNPISDKPYKPHPPPADSVESSRSQLESDAEDGSEKRSQPKSVKQGGSEDPVDGPDTSSFTAFLYSLLSSSESGNNSNSDRPSESQLENGELASGSYKKEGSRGKSLISRGKQSLGRAISQAARIGGYKNQGSVLKGSYGVKTDGVESGLDGAEMSSMQPEDELVVGLPDTSECSLLLSEKTRSSLYVSLPAQVQGRKWVLLYSTWRHGVSLSSLYRRSMLWPGLSLLVVGDYNGAVFGGLVEAPLKPSSKRKYQGSNSTFVFTNVRNRPVIFRPTGVNNYFTLCSTEFLALGGGGHFALYLDSDLMNGSSSVSETYGNSCLAHTEDFKVKEVELWGFVHASKYEEVVTLSQTEAPGICRW